MKEQIGILVTVIPGDSLSKEMACLEVLVTHVPMDAANADCVGTLQVTDIDADQTGV